MFLRKGATEYVLTNYFMVFVFGWPDPNTRESCES